MNPVASSNVASVGYDEDYSLLFVRFLNGSLYQYKNVPFVVYNELLNAPSAGRFLNSHIKGIYPFDKLE